MDQSTPQQPASPVQDPSPAQSPSQGQPDPSQAVQDPSQAPESSSPEPAAENARVAYALRRRERALAEREAKFSDLDQRAKELEAREKETGDLASLDEWQLLQRIAKIKGLPESEIIKRGIARVANGGKANPEHEVEDARTLAQKARDEAAALKAEIERRDAEAITARERELIHGYMRSAVESVDTEKHPLISDYDQNTVARMAINVANRVAAKTGEVPAVADVLEYLEKQERTALERRLERHHSRLGYAKPQAETPAAPTNGASPGAVTNGAAATRGNPAQPAAGDARSRISAAASLLRSKRKA